jgi:hypothetical protein
VLSAGDPPKAQKKNDCKIKESAGWRGDRGKHRQNNGLWCTCWHWQCRLDRLRGRSPPFLPALSVFSMTDEDEFRPRLGKLKPRRPLKSFVGQTLAAAQLSGYRSRQRAERRPD